MGKLRLPSDFPVKCIIKHIYKLVKYTKIVQQQYCYTIS
nr:MAG TPA: hypothetical protein [Bacteriophage sp.]